MLLHLISTQLGNRWYPSERLFVTAGLGTSTWPVRTLVPEVRSWC